MFCLLAQAANIYLGVYKYAQGGIYNKLEYVLLTLDTFFINGIMFSVTRGF